MSTAPIAAIAAAVLMTVAAPPAGDRLVTLPSHRHIHLVCRGSGAPTVILESGYGADAGAWYKVQPLLAARSRVCAYDRAGYGLSDPGPLPRNGRAIASDLDQALRVARIGGPFIGVGHSAGALYIRLFAARRPGEMVGMVLLDPSVEHQPRRTEALFGPGAGSIEPIRTEALRCLAVVQRGSGDPGFDSCVPGRDQPNSRKAALSIAHWRSQVSEIETLFTTTSDQVAQQADKARGVPTIILTASSNSRGGPDAGEALRRRFHDELRRQFTDGRQRLVVSSHMVMLDRPEAVVAAVDELRPRRR